MKKILIFDCWLPGFTYVRELASRTESVTVEFVHTSSLQTGAPAREYEDFKKKYDIPGWVHDFSSYDYDFNRMFDDVKPDAVLVLSLHYLESRTVLKYAKHLGVPTYFIPHGIFLLRDAPPPSNNPKSLGAKLQRLFAKLPRVAYYTRFFWSYHFIFRRQGAIAASLGLALAAYRAMLDDYFGWQNWPGRETQNYYARLIDNLIVYDASLEHYYRKSYGRIVDGARFVESGTLDVAKLKSQLRNGEASRSAPQRIAYFVSSPYPDYFDEPQASIFKDVMRKWRNFVSAAGYDRLIYRPHPGETMQFTNFVCSDLDIEVDTLSGVGGLLAADLVCGTSSSLLYIAVVLKKKLLILTTKRIKVDAPYYEPLISYSTVQFDADLERDETALADLLARPDQTAELAVSELKDPVTDLIDLLYEHHQTGQTDGRKTHLGE